MSTTAEIPKCFATTARGGTACGETGDTCPSVSDFQRAIELDPSSTQAEVWLGNAYFNLGMYGIMPPAVAFEKARQVTEQALKLDPDFAFAHAQRGDIHRAYDWDWAAADRELKLALALAPNDGNISFYCLHRPHDPKAAVTRPLLSKWGSCLQRWPQSF